MNAEEYNKNEELEAANYKFTNKTNTPSGEDEPRGEDSTPGFFWSLFKDIFWITVICIAIRSFLIQPVYIPSPSMMNLLLPGDYAFITKYNYGYGRFALPYGVINYSGRFFEKQPQRGDIIVFMPKASSSDSYIKRLIGLPGDKIQIKEGIVHINDKPLETNFLGMYKGPDNNKYLKYEEILPNKQKYNILRVSKELKIKTNKYRTRDLDNTREFTVPDKHLFFLGDNRDNSDDSRYGLGYVHHDNLIGKAQFIFFSTGVELVDSKLSLQEQLIRIYKWFSSIRTSRMFTYLYDKIED